MKYGRIVFWVVALVVIAGVAVVVPLVRRDEKLDEYALETRQEFSRRLAQTPISSQRGNAEYLDSLVLAAHDGAWDAHHHLESVSSGPPEVRIDVPEYERAMLRRMIEIARGDGQTAIADALDRVLSEWYEVE